MRKLILFISWILFWNISNAQKSLKNEMGIGVGTSETFIENHPVRYHNSFLFFYTNILKIDIPNPFFYNGAGGYLITASVSSPTLHYSRKLQQHLFFQLSYQYSFAKGAYYDMMYGSPETRTNSFKFNYHQWQFGYNYQLFKKKKMNPYVGIGFNMEITKSILQYLHIQQKYWDGGLLPYALAGVSLNLYKQISLKYEASIKTDLDYLIVRPINRLSVNYQF